MSGMTNGWIDALARAAQHEVVIGIWGLDSSGKTVFLGRLIQYLETMKNLASAHAVWQIGLDEQDRGVRGDYFTESILNVIKDGRLPAPTDPDTTGASMYQFQLRLQPGSRPSDYRLLEPDESLVITLLDAPGENYKDMASTCVVNEIFRDEGDDKEFSLLDYLSCCHGVLLLIDPSDETYRGSYCHRLYALLRELRRYYPSSMSQFLPQYFAIVFTKTDKLLENEDYLYPNTVAVRTLGPTCEAQLQQFVPKGRYSLMNVSVHHINEDHQIAPTDDREQFFNPDMPPYQLEKPLYWLLMQIKRQRPDLSGRRRPIEFE